MGPPSLFALASSRVTAQFPTSGASVLVRSRTHLAMRLRDVLPPRDAA